MLTKIFVNILCVKWLFKTQSKQIFQPPKNIDKNVMIIFIFF